MSLTISLFPLHWTYFGSWRRRGFSLHEVARYWPGAWKIVEARRPRKIPADPRRSPAVISGLLPGSATPGGGAWELAAFIVRVVNATQQNRDLLREAMNALEAVMKDGLTYSTEQETDSVVTSIKRLISSMSSTVVCSWRSTPRSSRLDPSGQPISLRTDFCRSPDKTDKIGLCLDDPEGFGAHKAPSRPAAS